MVKAKVNGIDCTIYSYEESEHGTICRVKYDNYSFLFPVLAELVEVYYDKV